MISISFSSIKSLHILHFKHGFPSCLFSQFKVLANILAVDVFPVPLGQHNKYAHTILLSAIAFLSVFLINSCHTRLLKS
jgi:hypothetical protein